MRVIFHIILAGLTALVSLSLSEPAKATRLEAARVTVNSTFDTPSFTSVDFQDTFDVVPVVVSLTTIDGSDPSALRIRNVTVNGFEIAALEPSGNDGQHVAMDVDYIAMEPGVLVLPGGETVAAGRQSVSAIQAHSSVGVSTSWAPLSFGTTLSSTASVIAAIQTMNSETGTVPIGPSIPFLTVALQNSNASSAQIALERSEVAVGTVTSEDIGWIAFPSGGADAFVTAQGDVINWESRITAQNIVGYDTGCRTFPFAASAFANARVVATKSSHRGNNGGWLRRCSLSSTDIGLLVDEDIFNDTERSHTTETANIIAFSDSFHVDFESTVTASKQVEILENPVPGLAEGFAIPGARARYTISVESVGNTAADTDSIVITDAISDDLAIVVDDIGGAGLGPVIFSDGPLNSNLSYNFGGLFDLTDDVDFSNDGGATFDYIPVPGDDGTDASITHIRINPKGAFEAASISGSPSFDLIFEAVIL